MYLQCLAPALLHVGAPHPELVARRSLLPSHREFVKRSSRDGPCSPNRLRAPRARNLREAGLSLAQCPRRTIAALRCDTPTPYTLHPVSEREFFIDNLLAHRTRNLAHATRSWCTKSRISFQPCRAASGSKTDMCSLKMAQPHPRFGQIIARRLPRFRFRVSEFRISEGEEDFGFRVPGSGGWG